MLEKETDIQGVVNITPDHQHGPINIAALKKGKAAISHKPVASVLHEVRRTVQAARDSAAPSHLLAYSNHPDRHLLAAWIDAGVIGTIREVHNWTNRPFWPQGMQEYHKVGPARARRLQLGVVAGTGARPRLPSQPTPSRSIEAGTRTAPGALATWAITACGSPTASSISASRSSSRPGPTTTRTSTSATSATAAACRRSPFRRRARSGGGIPPPRGVPSVDTFWYDGGMKPQTPEELYAGQRGSRRRRHAVHRRQGQDPVRLPRDQAAPDPRGAASRRSRGRSSPGTSTRRRPKTSGSTRSRTTRSPRAASNRWPRWPKR